MTLKCTMILGDCLEVMPMLPENIIQLCFADIPYAVKGKTCTHNTWDIEFPLQNWWRECTRLRKNNSNVIMTANAHLMAILVSTFHKDFRYDLVWQKSVPQGHLSCNQRPLRDHELIAVLAKPSSIYNPQMVQGVPFHGCANPHRNYGKKVSFKQPNPSGINHPRSVFSTRRCPQRGLHPTQKPVALLDWLIRTYSNQGEHVLDPTSGSGTTAVAALSSGRNVTCIERDKGYFNASVERVRKHVRDNWIRAEIEVRK